MSNAPQWYDDPDDPLGAWLNRWGGMDEHGNRQPPLWRDGYKAAIRDVIAYLSTEAANSHSESG